MRGARLLFFIAILFSNIGYSQELKPEQNPLSVENDITPFEKLMNFSSVYAAQWTIYAVDQASVIGSEGSFENWYRYPFEPRFDKDSFEFNLIKHSIAGNYYYLFYRFRGYSVKNAFLWSVISSLAFEFTVETVTERPSVQDIYQTPVLGTVVGIGVENLSLLLHSTETGVGHFFGYLLNPFTLFVDRSELIAMPVYGTNTVGAMLRWEF